MKAQVRKAHALRQIKRIRKELDELEGEPTPTFLQPIQDPEETLVVKRKESRRKRLLQELQRYQQIVDASRTANQRE